ncbi:hypothetical protein PR202_ga28560 [Eleusine coracana subsp. coracana]|uniref:Uncharacterized protein n=1 Tax=Eleusine coracana subsp. coracana TaxID=191504 RepID=A0AAV5DKN3_ELECO|nr:hypothetical protein PR202_ga28560 [Eleusine coracana subsp. coracana]
MAPDGVAPPPPDSARRQPRRLALPSLASINSAHPAAGSFSRARATASLTAREIGIVGRLGRGRVHMPSARFQLPASSIRKDRPGIRLLAHLVCLACLCCILLRLQFLSAHAPRNSI